MIKFILLLSTFFLLSGCVSKRGISTQYYNECKEYYDLQGYYHKECDEEGMLTYQAIGDSGKQFMDDFTNKKEKPKSNVW